MTLGEALKLYRLKNNLLQKQMAYLLGISKEYYCKIENDKIIPGRKLIQKITKLTGIKLNFRIVVKR
ncbi:helix-turn-helix transcriptional regulator [Candidatus Thermokryptus mobilis]